MDIHPPAHVLVVPPDEDAWEELMGSWGSFKKLKGFHPPKKTREERIAGGKRRNKKPGYSQ
jgi:hypothetical protein